jgi:hypothetical protein
MVATLTIIRRIRERVEESRTPSTVLKLVRERPPRRRQIAPTAVAASAVAISAVTATSPEANATLANQAEVSQEGPTEAEQSNDSTLENAHSGGESALVKVVWRVAIEEERRGRKGQYFQLSEAGVCLSRTLHRARCDPEHIFCPARW